MRVALALSAFVLSGSVALAQTGSNSQSTTQKPNLPTKVYAPKVSKKKKGKTEKVDDRERFYDRMDDLAKTRRKNEKMRDLPQYNNFQYFGHKKPPKKRPPEKMKYCKICGIRH